MKTLIKPIFLLLLIFTLSACSDDDDATASGDDCTGEAASSASWMVAEASGAYSGCLIGSASASLSERPLGGYLLALIGNRASSASGQSFTVNLRIEFEDEPDNPLPTGTFGIVSPDENSQGSGDFDVEVTIESEFEHDVSGSLTITEVEELDSGNNRIGGTFNLTASDESGSETITLQGEFFSLLQR